MSRITYTWDKSRQIWVESTRSKIRNAPSGFQIIRDLKPYKAAAIDKNTGKRPMIDGRAEHREFLKRNGYREVGNDWVEPQKQSQQKNDRISDICRAIDGGMPSEVRAYMELRGRK
jgi:hypothetical protein